MWVHEIKHRLLPAKLIISTIPVKWHWVCRRNWKGWGFVEQALFYARSTNPEKDYIIKELSLQECVKGHSQAFKLFIYQKIKIQLDDLSCPFTVTANGWNSSSTRLFPMPWNIRRRKLEPFIYGPHPLIIWFLFIFRTTEAVYPPASWAESLKRDSREPMADWMKRTGMVLYLKHFVISCIWEFVRKVYRDRERQLSLISRFQAYASEIKDCMHCSYCCWCCWSRECPAFLTKKLYKFVV